MRLSLSFSDWIVGIILLTGSLFLGLYFAYRIKAGKNSSNFFLGGRRITWPIVGASLFATNIGAEHLVGLSGDAYRYGLSAGTVELTTAITLGFACAVLFPYYIKNRIYTIPEFLELRYNRTARIFFSGLMLLICIMTKMAFTLFAGALVLNSILGWDIMTTVLLIGIITALFTIVGGFTAVAYTDTFQAFIMIIGCSIMLFLGLQKVGGWEALVEKVPESMSVAKPYDDPVYPFWGIIATAFYAGIFYWGIDQVNVQRVLAAPNLKQARWGAMFSTLLKFSPIFIFALPGVIALALYPGLGENESKQTFVLLLNDLLPNGLRGIVLASLMAALISSLIAVMNSVSTMTVRDFIIEYRPHISEKMQVFTGRIVILIATLLGMAAAYLIYLTEEGLYKYLQTISIYLVFPVMPAIVFGIISKKVTLKGAYISVMVGVVLATIFVTDQLIGVERGEKIFPLLHYKLTFNYAYRGLWGTLILIAVLFSVSAFTRKTAGVKLEKTTINWSQKFERIRNLSDWRIHWILFAIATVFIYILLR
ncbi:MAG: sodium/solute symporter [Bacteroidales bacterium]|nr:MAG: sodium/solute symporter [Bacteroidales bacterium]